MFLNWLPFLVHIPLAAALAWHWSLAGAANPLRRWFWPGLLLKCAAGVAVGLLYTHYYPYRGDTWVLFDESATLSRLAFREPLAYLEILFANRVQDPAASGLSLLGQPRALFMAKLLSLCNLFTFHNYWITGLYVSFFGFWGLWRLADGLARRHPETRAAAVAAFLFLPSVVFWSSGVLKETVAAGCLYGALASLLPLGGQVPPERRSLSAKGLAWIGCGLLLWVLWQLKFYYFAALLPAMASAWVAHGLHRQNRLAGAARLATAQVLVWAGVCAAAWLAVRVVAEQSLLASVVANHDATLAASAPGSHIVFAGLAPSAMSFVRHFPLALWSGLFAPLPWQARNGLAALAAAENMLLLAGAVWALARRVRGWRGRNGTQVPAPVQIRVRAAWLYIGLLAAVLALASPNFGALSRYKVGFLPVFLYLLLAGIQNQKRQHTPYRQTARSGTTIPSGGHALSSIFRKCLRKCRSTNVSNSAT